MTTTRKVISIIGTCDLHGRVEQLPLFSSIVKAIPNPYILVDAGDALFGSWIANSTQGRIIVDTYNALGYKAMTLGNHEFDQGMERLAFLQGGFKFPLLSCNLFNRGQITTPAWIKPYTIIQVPDGPKIAIIGATTQETSDLVLGLDNYEFRLIEQHVERTIRSITEVVDAKILVVHKGIPNKGKSQKLIKLANNLMGQVDVIVGGHTHGAYKGILSNIPTVQAASLGKYFGKIDLAFEQGNGRWKLVKNDTTPVDIIEIGKSTLTPDPGIQEIIDTHKKALKVSYESIIVLDRDLKYHLDLVLALDLVMADFFLAGAQDTWKAIGLEMALMNKGAIRCDLQKGALLEHHFHDAMPFDNKVVICQVPNYQLHDLIIQDLSVGNLVPAGFSWTGGGDIIIGNKRGLGRGTYLIAMSDYLCKLLGLEKLSYGAMESQIDMIIRGAKKMNTNFSSYIPARTFLPQ